MLYDEAVVVLVTRDGYSRKPDKGITREKGVMSVWRFRKTANAVDLWELGRVAYPGVASSVRVCSPFAGFSIGLAHLRMTYILRPQWLALPTRTIGSP